ncbi:hypothetical protein [Larkinella soli]|uniref:hypothetical protein n=1 Tax=Larkinella soli TaxID=1770527 RepID=UPI000FFBCE77|nr:hypothetical protein [Larkinella soli]
MWSQVAEQEFYDEIDGFISRLDDDWKRTPVDRKVLPVPASVFEAYVQLRQEKAHPDPLPIDTDGLPLVRYRGIRMKPAETQ